MKLNTRLKLNNKKAGIASVAFLIVLFMTVSLFFLLQPRDIPDDPISGVDNGRSQVLVLGKDYKIDEVQQKIHDKEQQEFQKAKEKEENNREDSKGDDSASNNDGKDRNDNSTQTDDNNNIENSKELPDETEHPGEAKDPVEEDPVEETSYTPVIYTELAEGKSYAGPRKTFKVYAKDYKGNYLKATNERSNGWHEVFINGTKVSAISNTKYEEYYYSLEFIDGPNKVTIEATDKYGNSHKVTRTVYLDEHAERTKIGTITFSLEATTLNLGYLIGPVKIDLYQGEQLSYVLDETLSKHGYGYTMPPGKSLSSGFYLESVQKKNITSGWSINEKLLKKLNDEGVEEAPHEKNSLGEKHFRNGSGWMYQVNGYFRDSGISTNIPDDGDVIRIRYTLHYGKDLGSDKDGDSWGDW